MYYRESGQALPLGLALVLIAVVTGLMVFDTGTAAVSRTRLSNAADAAAHGGLQQQARALNFAAYTNRAMVANQVAVAQAVSLRSWASYARVTASNLEGVLAPIPYLGTLAQAAQATLMQLEQLVSPAADWMIQITDQVNAAVSLAQEAMFEAALGATSDTVRSVVKANDPRFVVDSVLALASQTSSLQRFAAFTERQDANDIQASRERVAVIEASMDDFSRKRNWRLFDRWFPISPLAGVRLHREGETRLVTEQTASGMSVEWKAKDTLSLNTRVLGLGGGETIELPIGWSESYANSNPEDGSIETCTDSTPSTVGVETGAALPDWSDVMGSCNTWFDYNKTAEALAAQGVAGLSNAESSQTRARYNGLRAFRTLAEAHQNDADPRLELMVEVALPGPMVESTDQRGGKARWRSGSASSVPTMSALSVAEVFYKRPDEESIAMIEAANLYNPYWTVRLAAVPDEARLAAVAGRMEAQQ